MKFPTEPLKIHFAYTIIISLMIIIWVVSTVWMDDAGVLSHISLASALTSLILAVVAIFYSYISDSSVSNSLGKISQSADELTEATKSLSDINELLERHFANFDEKINSQMDTGFSRMIAMLPPTNQWSFASSANSRAKPVTSEHVKEMIGEPLDLSLDFIDFLGISGIWTFYVLVKAYESNIPFTLELIPKSKGAGDITFMMGSFMAYVSIAQALGYVEPLTTDQSRDFGHVSYIKPEFAERVIEVTNNTLKLIANDTDFENTRQLFSKTDEYFDNSKSRR